MAPHSSTLVWKIPWTEEPGVMQSMGSQRVGHDLATQQQEIQTTTQTVKNPPAMQETWVQSLGW